MFHSFYRFVYRLSGNPSGFYPLKGVAWSRPGPRVLTCSYDRRKVLHMSETITLDTPEQINAWVLLSRISQCHLHMEGYRVAGLHKWLVNNVPDCAGTRTVKAAYPRLLDYCDQFNITAPGGERCNYQVLITVFQGLYLDNGVFNSLDEIQNNEAFVKAYGEGRMVVLRTMDNPRARDPKIQMVMS